LIESWAWVLYLAFAWIISLALAIFNVLPIPALDGGRVVWVIIQRVFRIKPEKYFVWEWYVNTVFFILLMVLWIYIILKDLVVYWWLPIPFIG
jgi:regulator of sigma E protease